MKRTIKLLTLVAALSMFAAPALAQAKECTDEFKTTTYQKWYDNRKEHQDVAYQAAKEYLETCPADESPYKTALKKFKDAYDALKANEDTGKQFEDAVKNGKYADQVRLGKLVLANDPDNVKVYIIMGVAGLNDPSVRAESVQYAKKAIEMIEGGKPFAPLFEGNKEKALATLNYAIAKATLANSPTDAIPLFLKVARYDSDMKKNVQLYLELASAYENGPRAKLTDEYKSKIAPDGTDTPESKLVLANLNQIIDRQIDAWARAAAFATDPNTKKAIMDDLTALYKYRNKDTAGLAELVANAPSKPLPDMPTPITTLPATPATTPATGSQSGAGTQPLTSNGGAKPAATGTTPPANKKPHRNHRVA